MNKDIFVFAVGINAFYDFKMNELDGNEPYRIPRMVYVGNVNACRGIAKPTIIILDGAEHNKRYNAEFFKGLIDIPFSDIDRMILENFQIKILQTYL